MAKVKKNLVNPYLHQQFSNNSSEMFNFTMTNLLDSFYDSALDSSIDGSFKAVCLSGIKTEDNDGGSTSGADGQIVSGSSEQGQFLEIIVRPLTSFGEILPDPALQTDPQQINALIKLHASVFVARSDFLVDSMTSPQFGQVLNCYFEQGSIANSDFKTLRFSEPTGLFFDQNYAKLATMEGVQTALAAFEGANPFLLGTPASYESLGAEHLGAAESNFSDEKFGPGEDGVLRKKAWEALRPYLTKKTVLTSVYRGQDDQNRIIKNYATRYGFQGDTNDYDAMHAFIRQKPTPALVVGRKVGRGHGGVGRTGAFDLSGDNLDLIWQSIEAANVALSGKVKFAKLKQKSGYSSIIERGNNCVHVHFELSDINL